MPIRINLLAEAQAAEELKKRDPVKRAIWVGAFIVFLVLLQVSAVWFKSLMAKGNLQTEVNRWKSMEKRSLDVAEEAKRLAELQKRLGLLYRLSTNRFLWGSALDAIQECAVDQVQVTDIKATQRYTEVLAAKTRVGTKEVLVPAAQIEKITVTIDAKDYNPNDQSFNKFKNKLLDSPYLRRYLTKPESVRLANLSGVEFNALEPNRSFTTFTLECEFPETRRNE
jgi:hypothetical protein